MARNAAHAMAVRKKINWIEGQGCDLSHIGLRGRIIDEEAIRKLRQRKSAEARESSI
jgi:hypothetical protein